MSQTLRDTETWPQTHSETQREAEAERDPDPLLSPEGGISLAVEAGVGVKRPETRLCSQEGPTGKPSGSLCDLAGSTLAGRW